MKSMTATESELKCEGIIDPVLLVAAKRSDDAASRDPAMPGIFDYHGYCAGRSPWQSSLRPGRIWAVCYDEPIDIGVVPWIGDWSLCPGRFEGAAGALERLCAVAAQAISREFIKATAERRATLYQVHRELPLPVFVSARAGVVGSEHIVDVKLATTTLAGLPDVMRHANSVEDERADFATRSSARLGFSPFPSREEILAAADTIELWSGMHLTVEIELPERTCLGVLRLGSIAGNRARQSTLFMVDAPSRIPIRTMLIQTRDGICGEIGRIV